jgi:hypothetical protein
MTQRFNKSVVMSNVYKHMCTPRTHEGGKGHTFYGCCMRLCVCMYLCIGIVMYMGMYVHLKICVY